MYINRTQETFKVAVINPVHFKIPRPSNSFHPKIQPGSIKPQFLYLKTQTKCVFVDSSAGGGGGGGALGGVCAGGGGGCEGRVKFLPPPPSFQPP